MRVRNGSIEKISLLVRLFEWFAAKLSYFAGTDASNNELIKEHFFKVINSYELSVYQNFIEDIGSTIGSAKDIHELEKLIENIDRLDEITKEPIKPQLTMLKEKIELLKQLKVEYDSLIQEIEPIDSLKMNTESTTYFSDFSDNENSLQEKTTDLDKKLIDIKKLEEEIQALLTSETVGHDGSESLSIESLIRANISKSLTAIPTIIDAANYTVCQDRGDKVYQHRVIYTNHLDTISRIIEWSKINFNAADYRACIQKFEKVQNLLTQLNPIEAPPRPSPNVKETTAEGVSSRGPVRFEWHFYSVDEGDS